MVQNLHDDWRCSSTVCDLDCENNFVCSSSPVFASIRAMSAEAGQLSWPQLFPKMPTVCFSMPVVVSYSVQCMQGPASSGFTLNTKSTSRTVPACTGQSGKPSVIPKAFCMFFLLFSSFVALHAGTVQLSWRYWIAWPAPPAWLQALQLESSLSDRWSNSWQTLPPWVMKKSGKSCRTWSQR